MRRLADWSGRTLCENCWQHPAKKGRQICSGCYHKGARHTRQGVEGGQQLLLRVTKRPGNLVDTGLRIDNEFNELILPGGARQFPVPSTLSLFCWFDEVKGQPNLLRVLRAAPKGTPRANAHAA